MKVSRRDFVSTAGCAVASSLCALPSFGFATSDSNGKVKSSCALLDLKSSCALPESFDGMRLALGDAHRRVTEIELASNESWLRETAQSKFLSRDAALLVVAAAGAVRPETFGVVAALLEHGARVIWESGAAFLETRSFAEQQALVGEYLGISIGRPVDVWSQSAAQRLAGGTGNISEANRNARALRAIGHERVPYVVYRSQRVAHVRDFSRVIPVSAAAGHAIAHWEEVPVAWSKRVGAGTLVFIGSPIGPALRAGDLEAHFLFGSLIVS
jgi:hypothetical protein